MVKHNYAQFLAGREGFDHLRTHTYELVEFLHDVIKPTSMNAKFPHKVGIHNSCHAHRELGMASMSEKNVPEFFQNQKLTR